MKLTMSELILVVIFLSIINPGAGTEDEANSVPRGQDTSEGKEKLVDKRNSKTQTIAPAQQPQSTLPALPEATDTFDSIRRKKKLFVDKTSFIQKFMDEGGLYVVTRPKRFGKSVFLQMVRRFLEGEEEFFKNTAIATRGNGLEENQGWVPFPVIYIDFEKIPVTGRTATKFSRKLQHLLKEIAVSYKLKKRADLDLDILIQDLKQKTGKPVSILVDNYDLPLMNDRLSPELREELATILTEFYGHIRSNVDNVRLGLVVGLSALNFIGNSNARFKDLTYDERFLSAMGFNSAEFESTLKPYAEKFVHPNDTKFAKKYERIRNNFRIWYGKHRFSHRDNRTLLNPASICQCLEDREFRDYMGSSLIIPKIQMLFKKENKKLEDFEHYAMKRNLIVKRNFKPGKIPLPLFLLCTGFLTIVDYNRGSDTIYLNYPNREIKEVLTDQLPEELMGKDDEGKTRLKNALEKNAMERLVYFLNEFNFRDEVLSQSLRTDTFEYHCTKLILKSLKSADVDCEEGKILYSMEGRDEGDLDLIAKTDKLEHVIEVKYDHDAMKAVMQLICYIIEDEIAFLEAINVNKSTFLVGMNVQPSKTATGLTTTAINEWTSLPYRNYTIRIDEFRTSSNLEEDFIRDLKHRLTQKSENSSIDYVNSDKIVWYTTESV